MTNHRIVVALLIALGTLAVAGTVSGASTHGLPGASGTLWVTDKNVAGTTAVYDAGTGELQKLIGSGPRRSA